MSCASETKTAANETKSAVSSDSLSCAGRPGKALAVELPH